MFDRGYMRIERLIPDSLAQGFADHTARDLSAAMTDDVSSQIAPGHSEVFTSLAHAITIRKINDVVDRATGCDFGTRSLY